MDVRKLLGLDSVSGEAIFRGGPDRPARDQVFEIGGLSSTALAGAGVETDIQGQTTEVGYPSANDQLGGQPTLAEQAANYLKHREASHQRIGVLISRRVGSNRPSRVAKSLPNR